MAAEQVRSRALESEVERLRSALDRIETLADDVWRESQGDHTVIRDAGIMQDIVIRLRAAVQNELPDFDA